MKQSNLLAQDNSCSLMKAEKLESDEQTMLALRQALLVVPLPPSTMMTLTGTHPCLGCNLPTSQFIFLPPHPLPIVWLIPTQINNIHLTFTTDQVHAIKYGFDILMGTNLALKTIIKFSEYEYLFYLMYIFLQSDSSNIHCSYLINSNKWRN